MRKRYIAVLASIVILGGIALTAGLVRGDASALPTGWAGGCGDCHTKETVHNQNATHTALVNDDCLNCHTSSAGDNPDVKKCGGCHGGVQVIASSPTHAAQGCANCHAPAPPPAPAPTVTGVNPTSGPTAGGNSVVIAGSNFTGATGVKFGSTAVATGGFTVNSATQITATAPAGAAGKVDVSVTAAGGTSANSSADDYTYVAPAPPPAPAPTVTGVNPTSGPTAGGNSVVIAGSNFTGATGVKFGSTAVATGGFTVNSATQITATAPSHEAGAVDVSVTTSAGISVNNGTADNYTFVAPSTGSTSTTVIQPKPPKQKPKQNPKQKPKPTTTTSEHDDEDDDELDDEEHGDDEEKPEYYSTLSLKDGWLIPVTLNWWAFRQL